MRSRALLVCVVPTNQWLISTAISDGIYPQNIFSRHLLANVDYSDQRSFFFKQPHGDPAWGYIFFYVIEMKVYI